jgi:hypothetical protein
MLDIRYILLYAWARQCRLIQLWSIIVYIGNEAVQSTNECRTCISSAFHERLLNYVITSSSWKLAVYTRVSVHLKLVRFHETFSTSYYVESNYLDLEIYCACANRHGSRRQSLREKWILPSSAHIGLIVHCAHCLPWENGVCQRDLFDTTYFWLYKCIISVKFYNMGAEMHQFHLKH